MLSDPLNYYGTNIVPTYDLMAILACQFDIHLGLSKTQEPGYTCEEFFLIKSFEVGRPIHNPDFRQWKDPNRSR